MKEIIIPDKEFYDETNECFIVFKSEALQIEHSLYSLSKWESKWKKPFLSKEPMTNEETLDYIKCMSLNELKNPIGYYCLSRENIQEINAYMTDPMTATTITRRDNKAPSREILTAEVIYYYMTALNIPFECQYWHLNKLFTLIEVASIKSQPPKKMGKKQTMANNAALNAARRRAAHSKG